jgi:hypothetical protein
MALLLSFATVLGNSIALAVFLNKSFLVKKSSYLLVNLTIADLLVGVSGLIAEILLGTVLTSSTNWWKDTMSFHIQAAMILFNVRSSILTLSVISIERVFAVFWPFHHRLAKRWHYFTAIGTVWFLSVIDHIDDILTLALQYTGFAVYDGGIISFAIDIPNNHTRLISFHLDHSSPSFVAAEQFKRTVN